MTYSLTHLLTHLLTSWKQEMLAHIKRCLCFFSFWELNENCDLSKFQPPKQTLSDTCRYENDCVFHISFAEEGKNNMSLVAKLFWAVAVVIVGGLSEEIAMISWQLARQLVAASKIFPRQLARWNLPLISLGSLLHETHTFEHFHSALLA